MIKKNSTRKPNIWVTRHPDGGWQAKREKAERASGRFPTQQDAINYATKLGKQDGVEVIVQGRDTRIRSKDSYGNDPARTKDTEH
jgi:hypothetical protein